MKFLNYSKLRYFECKSLLYPDCLNSTDTSNTINNVARNCAGQLIPKYLLSDPKPPKDPNKGRKT